MITRIKTNKIIQSIIYCLFSTAVYCLLYIAHWAKFGQQVDVMSLEITWYQMIPNDITWCSMTLHGALLHHITMISCYITCWWYPVTLHDDDTLFNHMMSSDITFHVKKVGGGCSSCWLPHCKGPQVKTNRELKRNDKLYFNTFFYLLIFKTTPLSLKYAQEVK